MSHDRTNYRSYCEKGDEDTDAELTRGDFAVIVANLEALRLRAESAEGEARRLVLICQNAHDRILRGDEDAALLAMLAEAWNKPANA